MDTLLLTRSEVERLAEPDELLEMLRTAFVAHASAPAGSRRFAVDLPHEAAALGGSGMVIGPGSIPGVPAYSMKVHAKFPGSRPAIQGVLVLHDLHSGAPLAIMESSGLTALRTGLSAALGTHTLAPPEADSLAVIGAGVQARAHLSALRRLRAVRAVRVYDLDVNAAARFAAEAVAEGIDAQALPSLAAVLEGAQIVATTTWARSPFLDLRHIRPGLHVTALGADQPGKCEIAANFLTSARVVVDDLCLAVEMGAIGGAGLGADAVAAELGEVLSGHAPGRSESDEVTVFAGVGLPFQDLAAAWLVYRRASERGVGRRVNLLR